MKAIRTELINVLIEKYLRAVKRDDYARAIELTGWIAYIDHSASNREVAEYYLQYWNTQKNANRLKQLPLFDLNS